MSSSNSDAALRVDVTEPCPVMVVGVSHHQAPLSIREKLAILPENQGSILSELRRNDAYEEAVVLSTCNRVELYVRPKVVRNGELSKLAEFLCRMGGVRKEELRDFVFYFRGRHAAKHLFEVASGLDSMVPGENEILGQVKSAYAVAKDAGTTGTVLDHLFQHALKAAKRVRSRTGISERRTSIASVVAELAQRVFGALDGVRVMLVGAGRMARLTLATLCDGGARVVAVANRSTASAESLAREFGGVAASLDEMDEHVLNCDVLVSSAAAPSAVVTVESIRRAVKRRRGRPLLLVDLGVPRNIALEVAAVDGVILYNIDDLKTVIDGNRDYRVGQAEVAEEMIREEVESYLSAARANRVAATIAGLCRAGQGIVDAEVERALGRLGDLSTEQRREVGLLAHRILQKMLHTPISKLKEEARRSDVSTLEEALRMLFEL